jgi:oligosaccharyltransferase complex subunit gamma
MKVAFAGIAATALSALQAFAASSPSALHTRLIDLAAKNGGLIPVDATLFEQITTNNRDWSVALQFTAMAPNMKCAPCRYVSSSSSPVVGC